MADGRGWLLAAGWASLAAALLHLACLAGGPSWYRALGAGEQMARAAERGAMFPAVVTSGIAIVLTAWGAYAFSAAGVIGRLPLIRTALVLISLVLIVRGVGLPVMRLWRPDLSSSFLYWSSAIVLVYGLLFAIGTWKAWPVLSTKEAL